MKKQYNSYQDTIDFLREVEKSYPNLVKVTTIGKTHEEREIVLATISLNVDKADEKPALLYTGSIHAREWIGNELAIKFIEYITGNYQFDPRLEKTLESSTLYIVPCLNPDGFEYSRKHFSFWRKNRRKHSDGTYGVDLNRNFSVGFEKVNDKKSNVYGGDKPFSEPETRAIKEFVDARSNITISLDYHSQGNVFFPAHKFRHEAEPDGTDLNNLCANMSAEINRVTGRTYGIHRGKPPVKLISGSGREYYYSKGIKAIVVEVGTKNIPDYMINMTESIDEHIPALLRAFEEVPNYSSFAPKRVENFTIESVDTKEVTLSWDYEDNEDIYFEIYRNIKDKQSCGPHNRVGVTKSKTFTDVQLQTGRNYFYNIRAIDIKTKIKSPFAPNIKVRTLLDRDEFSKIIFPIKSEIGYLGQYTKESNRKHFGYNSLFVGVNKNKGVCNAVLSFSLANIPKNAQIKSAKLYIYPMNRVGAKIEKYGEWNVSIIDQRSYSDIYDFDQIEEAKTIESIERPLKSKNLTQGIWNNWEFSEYECSLLEKEIANDKVVFRMDGPKELPLGEDSQMMQFDIGYGQFGGGLHYRPMLDIKYTIPSSELKIEPFKVATISKKIIDETKLSTGFDSDGDKVYGFMEFDVSELPNPETTVITEAYIEIKNLNTIKNGGDTRFYLELVEDVDSRDDYESVKNREKIEFIGYEVANSELEFKEKKYFIFDNYTKLELERFHEEAKTIKVIIRATSPDMKKDKLIDWYKEGKKSKPKLVIKHIHKRKEPIEVVNNLKVSVEKGLIKLSWNNPKDKDFVGCYVVRNSFHPPKLPSDGVKLYGGSDSYTYDNFASLDKEKYYAVFTYDDVPNYSEPIVIKYEPKE